MAGRENFPFDEEERSPAVSTAVTLGPLLFADASIPGLPGRY